MKETFPKYPENVAIYAVGLDPLESPLELEQFRKEQGLQFPVAVPTSRMIADFRVLVQSTKVGIDGSGRIIYRDGYGKGGEDGFAEVIRNLSETAG